MEELSKMDKINNLAFDIMHATNQGDPFDCAAEIYKLSLQPNLNEKQKVVLEWLEAYADKDSGDYPMQTIFYMWDCIRSDKLGGEELSSLRKLTRIEQFEVLAAFAEWAQEQEED